MKNKIASINPFTNKEIKQYSTYTNKDLNQILEQSDSTFQDWKYVSISDRVELLNSLSELLNDKKETYAKLITEEMGKPLSQSIAEIDKCVWLCDFYAKNGEQFLSDELIKTEAQESFVSYDPLGCILGVMPWNYPFWQVFRFAIPTTLAGNTVIVKHASSVTGCSLAIESLFKEAGYPDFVYQAVVADHKSIESMVESDIVKAISLTGSEKAGKEMAVLAAKNLKKCVLELGGNNACILLDDADLDTHIDTIVNARMQNAGQSCIAAKRFIVTEGIYDRFLEEFKKKSEKIKLGNPMDDDTDMGPLVNEKALKTAEKQVKESVKQGAKVVLGGKISQSFFEPTIVTNVKPGMPIYDEETFAPVAAIIKVKDLEEAIEIASDTKYGLGTMMFTKDIETARKRIGDINDGAFFINELVKSDPRLPFGGTKNSGYGRELSREGIHEFVNKKTVYIK
ncbi:NAD-dependent succinate-semialdehyde dehydrogenase [Tenacibaculum sp. IB213877]|uniref:NAD-dependent succinate-semialdehyde dehydrogenase n=1 Tax=Tenacibaculum sp. IB213877 TaxID=3097351 RepID=UPI002A5AA45F|nr:NAD-dependent succinate-semialdehyde dehydrogenase [Tenacibaculum sp. IB213877]MDY0779328.1 NAD-dependent succinate-semialdehyde dehydrogenase [Tenacibaculum sp. IB213877]